MDLAIRIILVCLVTFIGAMESDVNCTQLGFDPTVLRCDKCVRLRRGLEPQGEAEQIEEECRQCCSLVDSAAGENGIYYKAELVTTPDALIAQQDLKDFAERKLPKLRQQGYQITVTPRHFVHTVLVLTKVDSDEVDYLEVFNWKTDELVEYIGLNLRRNTTSAAGGVSAATDRDEEL
ncbi:hypothetical protein FOL47_005833 [Perkinsus chesapeaki]|uniref:Selenoprotein F/M domain-containing protein n=1 Tax=Perkinsus chesapeaki TaxID=330153 RepID=A0A7J6LVC7_PERCH|nr:hypothetical protein FOL47_005833 [Perkinsus chesapeaki]